MNTDFLLFVIAILLFVIAIQLSSIGRRLKERFPTEKEQDRQWAKDDPLGHYEAHKKDEK